MPHRLLTICAVIGLTCLGGCVMFNDAEVEYSRHTTIGQELQDLKAAWDKGAMSEEEYKRVRKSVLEGGPVPTSSKEDEDD